MGDDVKIEVMARAICADLISDWDTIKRQGLDPVKVANDRWPEFKTTAEAVLNALRALEGED